MQHKQSPSVKFFSGEEIPLELHKVRIVQKLNLIPIEERLKAIVDGGFNTFLLTTKTVFLDMLTDSGTNAMSDNQVSAMLRADDAYAGSQSFLRLEEVIQEVFNCKYYLPVHQGRAAENIISRAFIKPGDVVPMNYHFTTTKAHIEINGGSILEIYTDEALKVKSTHPFKGNLEVWRRQGGIHSAGGFDQPDRRAAVLDRQHARGAQGSPEAQDHDGARRQPDRGECLLHQTARG
jgi:tryptophanase